MTLITVDECRRAEGHSVVACRCRTVDGFLPCPIDVYRKLTPTFPPQAYYNAGVVAATAAAVKVEPKAAPPSEPPPLRLVYSAVDRHAIARQSGYSGNQCSNCFGVRMRWNGTCEVCDECGTQGGCS